jgi:hypothetical protein
MAVLTEDESGAAAAPVGRLEEFAGASRQLVRYIRHQSVVSDYDPVLAFRKRHATVVITDCEKYFGGYAARFVTGMTIRSKR